MVGGGFSYQGRPSLIDYLKRNSFVTRTGGESLPAINGLNPQPPNPNAAQIADAALPPPMEAPGAPPVPYSEPPRDDRAPPGEAYAPYGSPQVPQEPTPTNDTQDNQWSSTGKTDTFGAFFNKRQGTDALTAFGAAMLKAPDFMSGLGDAALAVNAVDRENRMPTPEEIAKANIKARMASGKGAYAPKPIAQGYDSSRQYWTATYDNGAEVWKSETGATLDHAPPGFTPANQSGQLQRNKANEDYRTEARTKADQAQTNMATYDEILDTAGTAGVGSSLFDKTARGVASSMGIDLGDINLSDSQVFVKNMRNLELQKAQTQKGLGQFTEMERQIVRDALPSIDTNLATVLRVTVQMKLRDQLDVELYNDYMDMPESRRPSFEEYAYDKRREQKASYKERYAELLQQELSDHPEFRGDQKKQEGDTATPSILDEADKVVQ
jgi:hypothetical protein